MSIRPYKIAFLCTHNAGRSQMARAFFNQMADPTMVRAVACGTEPTTRVHPEVVDVMREVGIDLANERPRLLMDEIIANAILVVTMGCGDQCPVVPGAERLEWDLPDPKGQSLDRVRWIRDQVREQVRALVVANFWGRQPVNA